MFLLKIKKFTIHIRDFVFLEKTIVCSTYLFKIATNNNPNDVFHNIDMITELIIQLADDIHKQQEVTSLNL